MTLLLLAGLAVLTVAGYLGRDTIYQNYTKDPWTSPYFSLVFAGLHDGIFPWERGNTVAQTGIKDLVHEAANMAGLPVTEPEWGSVVPEEGTEIPVSGETSGLREFVPVGESYFDDALFIGDSRTVGLRDYGGLDRAVFYASVGLNIYDLWTDKFCQVDGRKCTLEEALTGAQFGKIYFQIGINEMGRGTLDGFIEEYEAALVRIRELQPDAVIYVQGIMCVAQRKSDTDAIFNNQAIRQRNERIAELADGRTIFYIDMNEVVCDAQGNLREELTFDDLHLYGSKYDIWVDFLLTKGLEWE